MELLLQTAALILLKYLFLKLHVRLRTEANSEIIFRDPVRFSVVIN